MACDLNGTLHQTYCLVGEQVQITAANDNISSGGMLDISDGGAGGSFDQGAQYVGSEDAVTWLYTPASAGTVTFSFSGGFYSCEAWPESGNALTVDGGSPPPTPVPCNVPYSATVMPGGQVVVTLDMGPEDYGGNVWTVDLATVGNVGSFDPTQVLISDATGGEPTSVQVTYTAPATPQTVQFQFQSDISGGGNILNFLYSPSTLQVGAAGAQAGFLTFLE